MGNRTSTSSCHPLIQQIVDDAAESPAKVFGKALVGGCEGNILDVLRACDGQGEKKKEACDEATAALRRCFKVNADVIKQALAHTCQGAPREIDAEDEGRTRW